MENTTSTRSRPSIQAFGTYLVPRNRSDPLEVPRAPDPHHATASLYLEVDPAVRIHHERGAVHGETIKLNDGIVRIPRGSEAKRWTLLSALQHRPGRCHSRRGARQRHPWYDPLTVFPISSRMTSTSLAGQQRRCVWRLKREAARIGLSINATKTKYLLTGDPDHLGRPHEV